jgi:hypothetical protein
VQQLRGVNLCAGYIWIRGCSLRFTVFLQELGHYARDCPKPFKGKGDGKGSGKGKGAKGGKH